MSTISMSKNEICYNIIFTNHQVQASVYVTEKMTINKARVFLLLLLLVYGASLLGGKMKGVDAAKFCPQICFKAAYMTCPSSGDKHITPICNCCLASTGCTLYNSDGTTICTAT